MADDTQPQPFKINVSPTKLDWINNRVKDALVIPDVRHSEGQEWEDGTPSSTIQDLIDYWKNDYNWRKVEARLNSTYKMFTVNIPEGDEVIKLHFVHHRSERADAIPLLFAHGWPGNFTEVEKLLSLTAPEDPTQQAFHIVAPTIPGFTFSSSPKAPGFSILRIGSVYHQLMLKLGYSQYIGQGGDWGSLILRGVALSYPDSCRGIHINMIVSTPPKPLQNPLTLLWLVIRWLSPQEKHQIGRLQRFLKKESGYSEIQGTKPQTVSYALLDSPVGMLAWIREKLEPVVTPDYVWDKEMVITWTMFYLLSESSWHARIYKEGKATLNDQVLSKKIPAKVAFGASAFPYDIGYVPLWWAKATIAENIVFWKENERGGHFPAVECGEVLKADVWEFVGSLPQETRDALKSKF